MAIPGRQIMIFEQKSLEPETGEIYVTMLLLNEYTAGCEQ